MEASPSSPSSFTFVPRRTLSAPTLSPFSSSTLTLPLSSSTIPSNSFARSVVVSLAVTVAFSSALLISNAQLLRQLDVLAAVAVSTSSSTVQDGGSSNNIFSTLFEDAMASMTDLSSSVINDDDAWDVRDVVWNEDDLILNQTLQERGLNVVTPASGCHIAAWVYMHGAPKFMDCWKTPSSRQIIHQGQHYNYTNLQPYDTVYVNIKGLQAFCENILPHLPVPIVLISGQFHKSRNDVLNSNVVNTLLHHERITKWFCHNIETHVPAFATNHTKLHAWPFGLQHEAYNPSQQPNPLPYFKEAFLKYHTTVMSTGTASTTLKPQNIMIGYVSPYTNHLRSNYAPSGVKLNLTEYYQQISQHRYLISPNGDRPECYRHYEAIGLGAIPLTELDATIYRHLSPGPVVYNMHNFFNLTEESSGIIPYVPTNRRLVTEEYWIEHVNAIVGAPDHVVRWADRLRQSDDNNAPQVRYADFVRRRHAPN